MKLLPKQIWKEEFNYYSEKSVEGLKTEIQHLFDNTKTWDFSVNLTGKFTSDFEFKMTPKWQSVIIKNYEREAAYLNGKIFADEYNKTCVTFNVRPNSIVLFFIFIFPIFGIAALTSDNFNGDVVVSSIAGVVFTFVVPVIMLVFGYFAKQGIKNNFIKTFGLKTIE